MYQFFPYVIFSFFSFIMLIFLAIYAVRYRENTGVKEFIFAMLTSAWWVFCQAFELMSLTLPVKLFWSSIEYLGTLSTFAYLMLVMRFTGYDEFLSKRNKRIVFGLFGLFYFFVFTDPYLGLMRNNFTLDMSAVPYTIDKNYGMLYPLYMLFTYSMNALSLILLTIAAVRKDTLYRKHAITLLIGLGFIASNNFLYILGAAPIKRHDIAPAFFGVSALVVSWGIFQNKLLNVMPIARNLLMEQAGSGVIVVDINNRIIDINGSALEMFGIPKEQTLGRDIHDISILSACILLDGGVCNREFTLKIPTQNHEGIYESRTYPFEDRRGVRVGTLIIIIDITENRKNTEAIISQQKALSIMEERERVGRELHDGLGQQFGYISTQAQAVREYMIQEKSDAAIKNLDTLIEVSRDAHANVREYILGMRGISPRNRNFSAVLKQYAVKFYEKCGIPVKVTFDDGLSSEFPTDDQGAVLLKIIQEALHNTRKHAGACEIEIEFVKKAAFTEMTIKDSGRGFDMEKPLQGNHYGLSIMKERASEMGAEFFIESQPGRGTRINLRIQE